MGRKVIKMKFNIYDYKDNAVEIDIKGRKVASISVDVISGDERIEIMYENGSFAIIDSSSNRYIDYYEGCYELAGNKLSEWMKYTPTKKGISYERLWKFGPHLN